MTEPNEPTTMDELIGARLKLFRLTGPQERQRQEDFVAWLNRYGLSWSRDTLASVEIGRRSVSKEEWAVLIAATQMPAGEWLRSPDEQTETAPALTDYEFVQLTGTRAAPRATVARIFDGDLNGDNPPLKPSDEPQAASPEQLAALKDAVAKTEARFREWWPESPHAPDYMAAWTSEGEADAKATRSSTLDAYDLTPFQVSLIAHMLWGRSLRDERDARAAERASDETSERGMQTLRGHVTRDLLEEIATVLEERGTP